MDWVHLHLLVNHFPIILSVAGALATVAALLSHSTGIWRYAQVTVLLAGLTAPAAYVTGLLSEETVEHAWYVVEEQVDEHEEAGLWALVALLAAGIAAAAAIRRQRPGAGRWVFVVLTWIAVLVTGNAALEGGEIVHDSPVLLGEVPASPEAGGAGAAVETPPSSEPRPENRVP